MDREAEEVTNHVNGDSGNNKEEDEEEEEEEEEEQEQEEAQEQDYEADEPNAETENPEWDGTLEEAKSDGGKGKEKEPDFVKEGSEGEWSFHLFDVLRRVLKNNDYSI